MLLEQWQGCLAPHLSQEQVQLGAVGLKGGRDTDEVLLRCSVRSMWRRREHVEAESEEHVQAECVGQVYYRITSLCILCCR